LRDLCREELNDLFRNKTRYYPILDKEAEPQKIEAALSLERKRFVYIENQQNFHLKLAANGLNYSKAY
jgi:hypothetical protein